MKIIQMRPAIDAETVEKCRDLLRMAESGQIVSIMAICEEPGGSRLITYNSCRETFFLLADCARLEHRINRRLDDAEQIRET